MLDPKKPLTHIAWAQYHQDGRFRKWVEIGEGRIDVDSTGTATAHIFNNRTPRGDTGYTCLLPIGVRPPDPQPQAKRPQSDEDEEI